MLSERKVSQSRDALSSSTDPHELMTGAGLSARGAGVSSSTFIIVSLRTGEGKELLEFSDPSGVDKGCPIFSLDSGEYLVTHGRLNIAQPEDG